MEKTEKTQITVKTTVNAPIEKIWEMWNGPEHIIQWCTPSDDWHTPRSTNDLRAGGSFSSTMAAKDGSFAFDFEGKYDIVTEHRFIAYTIADGRQVEITFDTANGSTVITETFEAEDINPIEMQQGGWQAIIDNFKKYAESH
jgi:uncharacterized protein YndB with AHSA1/START domain